MLRNALSASPPADGQGPSALASETPTLREERISEGEVDVQRAEEQFDELCRQLSRESKKTRRSDSKGFFERDIEKSEVPPEDEPFDLRAYLSSSNDKYQKAGLAHKHVGVTWEDLQVDVFGGVGMKVCRTHVSTAYDMLKCVLSFV